MGHMELIRKVRSGVAQIILERAREKIGYGTSFLVEGGLVTNSHNIRRYTFDSLVVRFEGELDSEIRLSYSDCDGMIAAERNENEEDYVYMKMNEQELEGRYKFEFGDSGALAVGEQVLFMGFPFGMKHLTAHLGYVSSVHKDAVVKVIQIDGSINNGNSGGPLLRLDTGKVVGIVTRAETGLLKEQFDDFIKAFKKNQDVLEKLKGGPRIRGSDVFEVLQKTQAGMEEIAKHIRRSANVGIGFAFASNYVRDQIHASQV